jgi:hypothetical protein
VSLLGVETLSGQIPDQTIHFGCRLFLRFDQRLLESALCLQVAHHPREVFPPVRFRHPSVC